jgi:hypothetical protein
MARISTKRTQAQDRLQRKAVRTALDALPAWVHPMVLMMWEDWRMVRDCCEGERAVKDAETLYLPAQEGMEDGEYAAFLERATFFNFTDRTRAALVGTIFRRSTSMKNIPERAKPLLERFSIDGAPFHRVMTAVALELITTGRYGALVDLPEAPSTTPVPFVRLFAAEDILDWEIAFNEASQKRELSKIVLREHVPQVNQTGLKYYYWNYRVLQIVNGEVIQSYYQGDKQNASLQKKDQLWSRPISVRGKALTSIPFHLFNVLKGGNNAWDVANSPLLEIARLNISHYRSSAQLEHGLFFTAMPVFYVEKTGEGGNDYQLGPSRVWEIEKGGKAGLIEFNGNGLKFLENALENKEAMAASLGGRLLGVTTRSTSESDNSLKLKDRNEQTMLLDVVEELDRGSHIITGWVFDFANIPEGEWKDRDISHNRDFLFDSIGSREFRALAQMYKDGVIPIDVVYLYLRKGDMIPDWMDIDEFKKLLENAENFPNNPDVEAKKEGYPDAKTKIDVEEAEKDRKSAEKTAEATAKAAAKAAPAAGNQPAAKPKAKAKPKPKA